MSEDEEYSQDEIEEAERAQHLIGEICRRCDEAGIEYEDLSDEENIGVVYVNLTVSLPSGRKKREVDLWDANDLEDFNNIEFEKYVIVGNYAAICCYDTNTIEAAFSIIEENQRVTRFVRRRILKAFGVDVDKNGKFEITELLTKDQIHKNKVSVTPISDELQILTKPPTSLNIGITIQTNKLSTHADAVKLLEKLSHSIFFAVEVKNGIAPTLLRKRQRRYNRKPLSEINGIEYPKFEYDNGPISLYWYARSAINMPLLQFLAYYQVIEFYFPVYFKAEINRKVRAILKDPSFAIERDSDVSRITSSISSKSGGYGTEKEQLKATLRECVENSDIQEFIECDKNRLEFFTSKQKGITQYPINMNNKNTDLTSQVADRIYDIRCKVVHVKSEDGDTEVELLLPYTEESEKLFYDIELVQLLAKKVLICSSSPLRG